jgi:hypothetical protein
MSRRFGRAGWMTVLTCAVAMCVWLVSCSVALAAVEAPGWEIVGHLSPAVLAPGGNGKLILEMYNTGAASGGEGVLTDRLPAGLKGTGGGCEGEAVLECKVPFPPPGSGEPYTLTIPVSVPADATGEAVDRATVSGGGAIGGASTSVPVRFGSAPAGAGFSSFDGWVTNADGTTDTQAGSHPYELTIAFSLNTVVNSEGEEPPAGGEVRDIDVKVPPGVVGNPDAVPQCPRWRFDGGEIAEQSGGGCPADSRIGFDYAELGQLGLLAFPVYNLVPPPGVAAQFGFSLHGVSTFLDARVRSGGDYGITEHVNDLAQRKIKFNTITLWGVPAESGHDFLRGGVGCLEDGKGGCGSRGPLEPFLTLPTSCQGPLTFGVDLLGTWQDENARAEASFLTHDNEDTPVGFEGCQKLVHFAPTASIAPDTSAADTPSGLTVNVHAPQGENPESLATAGVKNTTVTLPEGVVINPGQATGLVACQPSQENIGGPEAEGEGEDGPPSCPAASKVGTDEISTPLLPDKLEGSVYILQSNPPNLQLLIAASGDGVNLKLVGRVSLDKATGQLTTTFEKTPDIPFTDFRLFFSGGAQAALATPTKCGIYESMGVFTPWSSPLVEEAFSSSRFAITTGTGGGACASSLPFAPTMTAGATTDQAGGYTDFSMLLSRGDDQQRIAKLQFKTPEGLLGMISHVTPCEEPQAAQGDCSESALIGHTVVGAGPGPYPLYVPEPGQPPAPIYITGPYEGAPYGLEIVVPVVAGPFNLGTVTVRGKIEVDPETSQLTITTDPLPVILDGIPADLRTINAVIDRPDFMFNPTNCDPQSFSGTATSIEGSTASLSSPFQVGSCRSLTFKPGFSVSTSAKTSRVEGASLSVKVTLPDDGGLSSTANVERVKVSLPKQLPTPLTTLQKACLEKTFAANPASCPVASQVGQVKVSTPVLPGGLSGTAYFVSHGGAKYPELILVLGGPNGVTVQVHGETFISKAGITTATFAAVPDVPFSSFELLLPKRQYPALTGNGNLCRGSLVMPTEMVAQNGLVINQNTKITVTGCPKAKQASHKKKTKVRRQGRGKKQRKKG